MDKFNEDFNKELSQFESWYADSNKVVNKWNVTIRVYSDFYCGSIGTNPGWCGEDEVKTIKCVRFIKAQNGFCAWLWYNQDKERWDIDVYHPTYKGVGERIYKIEIV